MFNFPFEVLDPLVFSCGWVGEVLSVDFDRLGGRIAGLCLGGGLYPFGYVVFESLCQDAYLHWTTLSSASPGLTAVFSTPAKPAASCWGCTSVNAESPWTLWAALVYYFCQFIGRVFIRPGPIAHWVWKFIWNRIRGTLWGLAFTEWVPNCWAGLDYFVRWAWGQFYRGGCFWSRRRVLGGLRAPGNLCSWRVRFADRWFNFSVCSFIGLTSHHASLLLSSRDEVKGRAEEVKEYII